MKLIVRSTYLEEMGSLALTPDIKVITGIRRSGKSKLLEAFSDRLKQADSNANIIHINFNLTEFENLLEYHALEQYIDARFQSGRNNFVLIDEVQMCPSFEKAVNSLHAREKYDIWVTGSNAFLQSSDLATLFVGRTYEVHVFPFSFSEYLAYFPTRNLYASLENYIREGGMAGSYLYRNEAQKYRYINVEVLNALIVRDIMAKYHLRNVPLLHELIDFLMDNIGNVTSVRTIADTLASGKKKADHKPSESTSMRFAKPSHSIASAVMISGESVTFGPRTNTIWRITVFASPGLAQKHGLRPYAGEHRRRGTASAGVRSMWASCIRRKSTSWRFAREKSCIFRFPTISHPLILSNGRLIRC